MVKPNTHSWRFPHAAPIVEKINNNSLNISQKKVLTQKCRNEGSVGAGVLLLKGYASRIFAKGEVGRVKRVES